MRKKEKVLVVLFVSLVSFVFCNASPLYRGDLYLQGNPATASSMTIYRTSNSMLKDGSATARMSGFAMHGQTSKLMSINSSYSSKPTICEQGHAVLRYYLKNEGAALVSTGVGGPRRAGPIDPDLEEDDDLSDPIGDAVLPLLFCALIYLLLSVMKLSKTRRF